MITDFNDFEKLIHHSFYNEIRLAPEDQPLIIAESPLTPLQNRTKLIQICFEYFNIPALYLSTQQVLSLFACKQTTGIVLDSGHNFTHIVPVYEGFHLPHATIKLPFGGSILTQFLLQRLSEKGLDFTTTAEKEIVRDIKEKLCCVSLDFDVDRFTTEIKDYELPDGQIIQIGSERYESPEVLFQPEMLGEEGSKSSSVHNAIVESINKCDKDLHSSFYSNILLTGKTTFFQNFSTRFEKEIKLIAPSSFSKKIKVSQNTSYSSWIGGSVLGSISNFLEMCIIRDEYEEYGPDIMCRRFPWYSSG